MAVKKRPTTVEKRYDRMSIIDAKGGYLVYNAPFGEKVKPTVFTDVEELVEYVRDWAEQMIDEEDD